MELFKQLGYEVTLSEPCPIARFGQWWIHAKHTSGASVYGYGKDEVDALSDALATLSNSNKLGL